MKKSLKILFMVTVMLATIMLFSTTVKATDPTIEMKILGTGCFYVGVSNEFTITTTKGDVEEEYVVAVGSIKDAKGEDATYALDKLEYQVSGDQWANLIGVTFGGDEGFPLANATSKFRATFKKAGTYTVTVKVVSKNDNSKVVAEQTLQIEVKEPSISMELSENFYVGKPQEFSISTHVPEGYPTVMVVGTGTISDESALEKLEYYEVKDGKWYDLNGQFGSSAGFPLTNATSKFRATFKKAGTYTVTYRVANLEGQTIAENKLDITVFDTVDNQIQHGEGDEIDVTASSGDSISKDVLNSLKDREEKTINIHLENGITISFNTKNIKDPFTEDLSLEIDITKVKPFEQELTGFEEAELLYIDMGYSGVLPTGTQITFSIGNSYNAGDKVYLYYYNPSTQKPELVSKDIVITKEGTATISVDHASTYFLSKTALNSPTEDPNESPNNGNQSNGGDKTEASGKLPQTGVAAGLVTLLIATVGISIFSYIKIRKYRGI